MAAATEESKEIRRVSGGFARAHARVRGEIKQFIEKMNM